MRIMKKGFWLFRLLNLEFGVWRLAILHEIKECMPPNLIPLVGRVAKVGESVSFPKHHGGRHVEPIIVDGVTVCPQVLGVYKLQPINGYARPCQMRGYCLPG